MSVNSDRPLTDKLVILFPEEKFESALEALYECEGPDDGQLEHLLLLATARLQFVHVLHEVAQVLKYFELPDL